MIALQNNAYKSIGLELLREFIATEELSHTNFFQLEELLSITAYEYRKGRISKDEISKISLGFGKEFLENTLHGRGFLKPNGYPGDYLFLDRIYTNHISEDSKYKIWDEYVQQSAAPNAVRNRKEYFKHLAKAKAKLASSIKVLNIISGSGRELVELYNAEKENIFTTCVEIDDEAIAFSKELNKAHLERIEYVNSNIFRYQTEESYDFIWSAGLFDYLNDRAFVKLLRRFKGCLKKGGEIVVGNYNEAHNPSRDYMEILGDWHLIHRTETQLLQLAKEAGFAEHEIHVSRMPDNVILYLHIHCL
ncbi:class I SAM-dependent methyltransferase [Maribacter algarum]|uniref:Class I SAM-dependent methyltransferase n=1 Tax=Maribacter algarum (ex Zhang et al. 2020) TaxID=2578118 RepID=A0A5S3PUQ3_9FLAO|nr:class I SAM-dependent methyltransferase [Maribacter algarum]TMM58746.1 class I SAM-dependent methyltransferase [Maribacter algarum]